MFGVVPTLFGNSTRELVFYLVTHTHTPKRLVGINENVLNLRTDVANCCYFVTNAEKKEKEGN